MVDHIQIGVHRQGQRVNYSVSRGRIYYYSL